ncbi:SWIM zinc finger family protein [Phytopseudomonas dryadis]|uniref:SWIM-type domain-containing protein n=1 Tax=Phytopseudomonas dryadis TaxID=2487520 RepID=A0ABY1ZDR4_9GAMM|nr:MULTISPECIES: DUF6880 family protein [Pseudomonas]TBV09272.1 hypothetical protein DNK34_01655 [Pseudomonas dryadis]TBV12990.1 hypothetical protein DNK41_23430 [Pseudomonas sp. FRB 230]
MTPSFSIADLEYHAGSEDMLLRGQGYVDSGAVHDLQLNGNRASARVIGSDAYHTTLEHQDGELLASCDCPHAARGFFCKHAVALGLAWLERLDGPEHIAPRYAEDERLDNLRAWLDRQPQAELAQLLFDQALRDTAFMRQLWIRVELDAGQDRDGLYDAIDDLTKVDYSHGWDNARTLASGVESLLQTLQGLLTPTAAASLSELCEYAIQRVESMLEQVDDSDAEFSWSLQQLQALHFEACQLAPPEPLDLAQRLFEAELNAKFDAFDNSALVYQELLGQPGLQRFQELALQHWQALPPNGHGSTEQWRITHIMETLARQSGDLEALVAIKRRDLSLPYHYLAIAELYHDAQQADKALQWAEQGLATFGPDTDARLLDFLAERYLESDRHAQALGLIWSQFEHLPRLENYQKLQRMAQRLGCWPEQRERALAHLESPTARQPYLASGDQSLRLAIALWEQDLSAAWQAFHKGPCQQALLVQLAEALEADQPLDAATIYQQLIPKRVEQTNNRAYEDAIKLLRHVATLIDPADFATLCQRLRQRYKAKRNFIKLLDGMSRAKPA